MRDLRLRPTAVVDPRCPRHSYAPPRARWPCPRGVSEIVDKFAKREIYIEGVMAEMFKQNVEALIEQQPTEDEVDEFLAQFTGIMQQPVVLH